MRALYKPDGYHLIEAKQTFPSTICVELFTVNTGPNQPEDRAESDYFRETYMPNFFEVACINTPRTPEGNSNTTLLGSIPVESKEELDDLIETIGIDNYRCKIEPLSDDRRARFSSTSAVLALVIDTLQENRLYEVTCDNNVEGDKKSPRTRPLRLPSIRNRERYSVPTYTPTPQNNERLRYHISRDEIDGLLRNSAPARTPDLPAEAQSSPKARTQADANARGKRRKNNARTYHS